MSEIKARLIYDPGSDDKFLYIRVKSVGQTHKVNLNFEKVDPYTAIPYPNFNDLPATHIEIVQAILNEAWEQGMRPIGFTDIKNETTALKMHIEDFRKIIFKTLNIK
jgi:hypothetical protein